MDMMIPYLGPITRLAVESKSAFHIAGVQHGARAKQIELEEQKKREIEKKKKLLSAADNKDNKPDEDDNKHLDTWA